MYWDMWDQFLIGNIGARMQTDEELYDSLPPSYHAHLFFGEVETDIVVDQLWLGAEFGEGGKQLLVDGEIFLHIL